MNYRNNALRELQEFAKSFPEYSVGEIIYAISRKTNAKTLKELLEVSDEDFYTSINKAIEIENA